MGVCRAVLYNSKHKRVNESSHSADAEKESDASSSGDKEWQTEADFLGNTVFKQRVEKNSVNSKNRRARSRTHTNTVLYIFRGSHKQFVQGNIKKLINNRRQQMKINVTVCLVALCW